MGIRIRIAALVLFASSNLMAQVQEKDTVNEKVIQLNEVIVKGVKYIPKGDHTLLFLSKKNRNFGTNALDAVSSLGLFRTTLNETELTSFDHKQVFVLINGIPSTALDLRTFKADEVKNVEYYPIPPAQYMALTSGPVANIVMKKKHNKLYTAYINTSNAVTTGFGTNQANFTYADSLNQVKVNYFTDYRNVGNISLDSYYDYGKGNMTIYRGDDNRYKGNYQYVQTTYQRFQSRHLFNANLKYIWNPRKQSFASEIEMPEIQQKGTNADKLESHSRTLVADLFYNYSLGKRRSLAVNVVNTFSKSSSDHFLQQEFSEDISGMNSHIDENIKNRTYSFLTNVAYSAPLLGGSFSAGAKYEYLHLRQQYLTDTYLTTSHTGTLYTGVYWKVRGITLYPTLGLYQNKQITESDTYNSTLPYFRLYSDWWGKKAWKGFSVQLTTQIKMQRPTSGQLTTSATHIDRNFIAMGNPNLKPYWEWNNNLLLAYFSPNNDNQIVLQYTPKYRYHPFVPTLSVDNNIVYSRPQKISHSFDNVLNLFGSWYPVSWLEFSPYVEYYYSTLDTPSQDVRLSYFRTGCTITISRNSWALTLAANSPTKEVSGDLTMRGSAQFATTFQYKYKDWAFGAKWNYSAHNDYVEGKCEGFSYKENKDWKPLHSMVRLTATWSFSKVKARRHQRKSLNNEYTDDGLTNDNTPKMAN